MNEISPYSDYLESNLGICIWDQNSIITGNMSKGVSLISSYKYNDFYNSDFYQSYPIKDKNEISEGAFMVKKIFHPKYKECLICQTVKGNIMIYK